MRKMFFVLLLIAIATPGWSAELQKGQQELSYAIGMSIGGNLLQQKIDLDLDKLSAGIAAAYTGKEALLSQEEMVKVLTDYQKEMQAKQIAEAAAAAEKNKAAGQAYLADNAKKDGVKTTDSGLQYEVLTKGDGVTPGAQDQVTVNYRGTLIDGTEFDSSYKRGQPATFGVSGVISGWTEALQLMKEGDKFRLVIPAELAYGDRCAPPVIEPGSTLVFEVELVKVNKN